jgi:opacity protein-like surface antigen
MRLNSGAIGRSLAILAAMAAFGRTAPAADLSGLYIGGDVGRAQIDANNALYQAELEGSVEGQGSLDFTKASLSKRHTAWWADTGYMVWPSVGIDLSYFHFGQLSNQVSGTYTPVEGGKESVYAATSLSSAGPALGVLVRLPLLENFDVNLRLADYYGRTRLTNAVIAVSASTAKETANSSSLLLGVGAAYTFYGHWSAKLDYTRVDQAGNSTKVVKYDVDMLSVGVNYAF